MGDDLIKGIEDFVNRPVNKAVADRVSKYVTKLGSGDVGQERVLNLGKPEVNSGDPQERQEWNAVHAFFSPVGYRPLFEQEIIFLMGEGLSYESIMQMPIHLRKKLIDCKLERQNPEKTKDESEPEIPAHLLEQFRMAARERRMAESPLPQMG